MKEKYIELMEKALSAYTDEHIKRYFEDVKTNGLTEHGFPRLTVNIGILIAHGRRKDLLPLFADMMEICCDMFLRPYVKAANEFSVREIVCCIDEIEKAKAVDAEHILRWKEKIRRIVPEACYNVIVHNETDRITNWAIFGAVSEYARFHFGLGENLDFVDRQLSCQFQWLDDNGMYRDNPDELPHQPLMYDFVPRMLFSMLLHWGYRGKYYEKIDSCLKKAGVLTLAMQSSNGEVPFGGRSNQFVLNEALMMAIFEYEACRYSAEGNTELAMTFKSAIAKAFDVTERWLGKNPIRHIKNRFPTETNFGCEGYAYFDKYMITVASLLYNAYLLCDDSIPSTETPAKESSAFQTSQYFHKLFLKNGGYAIEIDTNADPHYDASGLGRVHREGAPATICMSCPCPSDPMYTVDTETPFAFSLCSAIRTDDKWSIGAENGEYAILESSASEDSANATVLCSFANAQTVKERYTVNENGVSVCIEGNGDIGYALPALYFDGEAYTQIICDNNSLTVSYDGWMCRYTASGAILELNKIAANRNGHYRTFLATAKDTLSIKIEIVKE